MAVPVPRPARARIQNLAIPPDFFEPRAIDAPYIAVSWWDRASAGNQFQSLPRKRKLDGPAAIDVAALVQRAVNVYGMPEARKIPIEESPSLASRMHMAADAIQHHGAL